MFWAPIYEAHTHSEQDRHPYPHKAYILVEPKDSITGNYNKVWLMLW